MSRVFFDLNVVVDALDRRSGFEAAAVRLCHASEMRRIDGFISAHALTTLSYLIGREGGNAAGVRAVRATLSMLEVVPIDRRVLTRALDVAAPDYEDAVSLAAAEAARCELIVTRDPRGFTGTSLMVLDPRAAVELLLGPGPEGVAEPRKPYAARRAKGRRAGRRR